MVAPLRVKSILAAVAIALVPHLRADDPPDARELLKSVRIAQSSQNWKLSGRLRVG